MVLHEKCKQGFLPGCAFMKHAGSFLQGVARCNVLRSTKTSPHMPGRCKCCDVAYGLRAEIERLHKQLDEMREEYGVWGRNETRDDDERTD